MSDQHAITQHRVSLTSRDAVLLAAQNYVYCIFLELLSLSGQEMPSLRLIPDQLHSGATAQCHR